MSMTIPRQPDSILLWLAKQDFTKIEIGYHFIGEDSAVTNVRFGDSEWIRLDLVIKYINTAPSFRAVWQIKEYDQQQVDAWNRHLKINAEKFAQFERLKAELFPDETDSSKASI